MSTFRNIIARRRPTVSSSGSDTDAGSQNKPAEPTTVQDQPLVLHKPIETPRYGEDLPKWEPEPPQRTIGEHRPDAYDGAGADEKKSATVAPETTTAQFIADVSADPTPVSGPGPAAPSVTARRRIWDLDTGSDAKDAPAAVAKQMERMASAPIAQVDPADIADIRPAPAGSGDDRAMPMTRLVMPFGDQSQDSPQIDAARPVASVSPTAGPGSIPAGQARATRGRVKTRLLGFHSDVAAPDVFAAESAPVAAPGMNCPVGWVVIVDGPGRGASFALSAGLSMIGRGADQTIALDFGDTSISRANHASIAYDEEDNKVLIGHGGKSNLVRLNGRPLLTTEELTTADHIRIGKTTLRYIALCGPDFSWLATDAATADVDHG